MLAEGYSFNYMNLWSQRPKEREGEREKNEKIRNRMCCEANDAKRLHVVTHEPKKMDVSRRAIVMNKFDERNAVAFAFAVTINSVSPIKVNNKHWTMFCK